MYIILGIIIEIVSIIITSYTTINSISEPLLKLANKGYKIDKEAFKKYKSKIKEETKESKKQSKLLDFIGILLFILPGINILTAYIKGIIKNKKLIKNLVNNKVITTMSEEELKEYSMLDKRIQKITYTMFDFLNNNEDLEIVGFAGFMPLVRDHSLLLLRFDELPYFSYTLDDVKKLNEATNYLYKIGRVDDRNIAIIGINENIDLKRVGYISERFSIHHDFEPMSEEEAKDKTFVIYPYTLEDEELLNEKVNEIIQSRKTSKKRYTRLDPQEYNSYNITQDQNKVLSLTSSRNYSNQNYKS